ncbi:hypothetical protein B0H66DRAFT_305374 [Apodospora peruviana]|uniref:Uncharacterized protein n=1 Tax=Apodospora peruviana TaxID=516989 RepID=A0AAE0I1W7_9PEZI|nr:hypothetical protein B0H66DRAFT_305374 [Apodospora peruviana]
MESLNPYEVRKHIIEMANMCDTPQKSYNLLARRASNIDKRRHFAPARHDPLELILLTFTLLTIRRRRCLCGSPPIQIQTHAPHLLHLSLSPTPTPLPPSTKRQTDRIRNLYRRKATHCNVGYSFVSTAPDHAQPDQVRHLLVFNCSITGNLRRARCSLPFHRLFPIIVPTNPTIGALRNQPLHSFRFPLHHTRCRLWFRSIPLGIIILFLIKNNNSIFTLSLPQIILDNRSKIRYLPDRCPTNNNRPPDHRLRPSPLKLAIPSPAGPVPRTYQTVLTSRPARGGVSVRNFGRLALADVLDVVLQVAV